MHPTTSLLVHAARPSLQNFAVRKTHSFRDLLSTEEAKSLADYALMEAAIRFNPMKGAFRSYAQIWVMREIFRYISEEIEWKKRKDPLLGGDHEHDESVVTAMAEEALLFQNMLHDIPASSRRLWMEHLQGHSLRELSRLHRLSFRRVREEMQKAKDIALRHAQ